MNKLAGQDKTKITLSGPQIKIIPKIPPDWSLSTVSHPSPHRFIRGSFYHVGDPLFYFWGLR